jgi:teichoic acid transport system permease protein
MNKKRYLKIVILAFLVLISNALIFKYCNFENNDMTLSFKLKSDKVDAYQLYYGNLQSWTEDKSQTVAYTNAKEEEMLKYGIPQDTFEFGLRLGKEVDDINISDFKLSYLGKTLELDMDQILNENNHFGVEKLEKVNDYFHVQTKQGNSFLVCKLDSQIAQTFLDYKNKINNILKIIMCIILDILIVGILKKSKSVIMLFQELTNNKTLIWNLSKNDFKTKYAGSYLGITWAFIQPIITIIVYWIVFEYGLKAGAPIIGVPYIVWFMSGLIPWFFFQEALINATNCMIEYSYLVKKVVFKISILPIVKIVSSLFVNLVFIGFLFVVCAIYGFYPSQYTIQLIYYSFCTFVLVLGISYATGAMILFFKDLGQIINIILQIGMWATPIMWSYSIVPNRFQWIVKLNPIYYIVEGYRDTIINKVWFFQRYFQTVYFWVIALGLFMFGAIIFKKLKPHFADVL